jgi:hypothetical protein
MDDNEDIVYYDSDDDFEETHKVPAKRARIGRYKDVQDLLSLECRCGLVGGRCFQQFASEAESVERVRRDFQNLDSTQKASIS